MMGEKAKDQHNSNKSSLLHLKFPAVIGSSMFPLNFLNLQQKPSVFSITNATHQKLIL